MSAFLDKLTFEVEPIKRTSIVLTNKLRYRDRSYRIFTVPEGFHCDLASVPRWARSVATPWNQSARAGVLHDCGYRWFEIWRISRRDMDELYMRALVDDGVKPWRAWVQRAALRIGAGSAWKRWRRTPDKGKGVRPPIPAKRRGE